MNLSPLFDASLAIRLHVATVVPAAIIGGWLMFARKGTPVHRLFGRVWLLLMMLSSLSSFFIHQLNLFMGFSLIHLLSVAVLFGCVAAFLNARAGNIAAHRFNVIGLYLGGIVGAGAFTIMPGRIMNRVLFETSADPAGFVKMAMFVAGMAGITVLTLLLARTLKLQRS